MAQRHMAIYRGFHFMFFNKGYMIVYSFKEGSLTVSDIEALTGTFHQVYNARSLACHSMSNPMDLTIS